MKLKEIKLTDSSIVVINCFKVVKVVSVAVAVSSIILENGDTLDVPYSLKETRLYLNS